MKTSLLSAAMVLAIVLGHGVIAVPARSAEATEAQSFEVVAGEVTKLDLERGRVTVRSSDGGVHEFEASAETLKSLKLGDRIEAKRRPTAPTTSATD